MIYLWQLPLPFWLFFKKKKCMKNDFCLFTQKNVLLIFSIAPTKSTSYCILVRVLTFLILHLILLPKCLLFEDPITCHLHCCQCIFFSFLLLAGSALICWIYYCNLTLFICLVTRIKIWLNQDDTYAVLQNRTVASNLEQ